MTTKAIFYARVSTSDQTVAHQLSMARQAGFEIDEVIVDEGVSGVSTRLSERDQGKRLFDMLRRGDTLVVRWIDRLGRNYSDVCDAIREFMRRGVVVRTVIGNMTFDGAGSDPMLMAVRDALISFLAATAQAQGEATRAAQAAGIAHAKSSSGSAYLGRKASFSAAQAETVANMLAGGHRVSTIAEVTGLTRQTVYRLRDDPAWGAAILARWESRAA
jgi:DNA invertase Pin-like site-specific DNA recombinase